MKIRDLTIISLLILLIGCNQKQNILNNTTVAKIDLNNLITKNNLNADNFKKIIIIPNVGCGSCISDAQTSFTKNYNDTTILYIFTAIEDLKLFKNVFSKKELSNKNVIVDTANLMSTYGFNSIYPVETKITESDSLEMIIFKN